MANRHYTSQFHYSFHKKLVTLTSKFTVLATNAAGVTGFAGAQAGGFGKPNSAVVTFGNGIKQVFGKSSSPGTGNNCANANFQVQLQDNYSAFLGWDYSIIAPLTTSGATSISAGLSKGTVYQIVAVGTSTAANWQAVGLPLGYTPAAGQNFMASTNSAGTGTGTVKPFVNPTIYQLTLAGDPNPMLNPVGQPNGFNSGAGGYLFFQTWGNPLVGSATDPQVPILTQPVDNTIIELTLYFAGA